MKSSSRSSGRDASRSCHHWKVGLLLGHSDDFFNGATFMGIPSISFLAVLEVCIHEAPCLQRQTAGVQSQFGIQLRRAGVHRWLRVAAIRTAVSQTEIFASSIFQTNIMYVCCPRSTEKLDSHEDDFKKTYPYSAPCLCASCLPGFVGLRCWADVCQ